MHTCRWQKLYGVDDPMPNDNPGYDCSASLKYYKQVMPYFMTNPRMYRDEISKVKNPTRLDEGETPRADRAFENPEFDQAMEILEPLSDFDQKRQHPTMSKLRFQLIARVDDTCNIEMESFKPSFEFPFDVMIKL
eukprot:6181143-Ditylum_brightwellii.AAC.1